MLKLRGEFLKDAVDYVAAMAVGSGDYARAEEALEWLLQVGRGAMTTGHVSDGPVWLVELRDQVKNMGARGADVEVNVPPPELKGRWIERLEQLVLAARAVELAGSEPLGERPGREFSEAVTLLGALEDSYVLSLSEHQQARGRRLALEEVSRRLQAVKALGTWDPPFGTAPPRY